MHLPVTGSGRPGPRPAATGAVLVVASALALALDGPVARAAYQHGLDPAAFGFWRACAGALVLGGFLAIRPRPGLLAAIRRLHRAAVLRLALAALAGLGLATLLLLEGVLAGAVAPLLFLAGLRRIGATRTAVLSLAEPLAATLLAAVMLRQLPAPSQLAGAALLVGAGIAVQARPSYRRRRAPRAAPHLRRTFARD